MKLLLLVFLLPLLTPLANLGFEAVKVLFWVGGLSIAALVWRPKIIWSKLKIVSTLFILALLLASLLGVDPLASLTGRFPYYQGWVLYSYLYVFYLVASSSGIKLDHWKLALALSGLIVSLFTIKEWVQINFFHLEVLSYAGRPVATFGQPNFAAGFILMSLPFIYSLKPQKGKWALLGWLLALLTSILAILAASSRAATLILLGSLLLWLALQLPKAGKMVVVELAALAGLLLVASFQFSGGLLWDELKLPQTQRWLIDNSPEKRVFLWPALYQSFLKRPIFGYGLDNIAGAFPTYQPHQSRPAAFHKLKDLTVDRSHNYLLDLAVFAGALGPISWLVLVILALAKAKSSPLLLSSLLIYLVWVQLQNQSVVHLVYFWLIVSLLDNY